MWKFLTLKYSPSSGDTFGLSLSLMLEVQEVSTEAAVALLAGSISVSRDELWCSG